MRQGSWDGEGVPLDGQVHCDTSPAGGEPASLRDDVRLYLIQGVIPLNAPPSAFIKTGRAEVRNGRTSKCGKARGLGKGAASGTPRSG